MLLIDEKWPCGVGVSEPSRRTDPLRWYILLGLLIPFSILTYLAVRSGAPDDVRERPILLSTLGTISGPFTGAIARRGQACCVNFSLRLLAICAPALAVGILSQFGPYSLSRPRKALRIGLWSCGWLVWLLGAPASFLHALS